MQGSGRMTAPRGPIRTPGLRVPVDADRRTNLRSFEKLDSVLFRHPDAPMGIRMPWKKSRVETDRRLKLDVVSHRRLDELEPGRDSHVLISVWNNDLFRRRVT